jgi:hypothetical protein
MAIVFTDNVTPLNAAYMNLLEQLSNKNVANGYLGLDAGGAINSPNPIYSQPAGTGVGFVYFPAAAGGAAFYSAVQGEPNARFRFSSDGRMEWGPGGSTPTDTTLYRVQAGILGTDGQIYLRGASSYLAFYQAAEAAARFYIGPGGNLNWGPGTATQDTTFYRASAGVLKTDGNLQVGGYVYANIGAAGQIWLHTDGSIYFGSASDVRLSRSAAGALTVQGDLFVTGNFDPTNGRLGVVCKQITDWNLAVDNGWYMGSVALNAPAALTGWVQGEVIAHGAVGWRVQRVWDFTAGAGSQIYERRQLNGTWTAWVPAGFNYTNLAHYANGASIFVGRSVVVDNEDANQKLYFGSALDTYLWRSGANALSLSGSLEAQSSIYSHVSSVNGTAFVADNLNAGGFALLARQNGDTQWRFYLSPSGQMTWGPGGTTLTDTTLYRGGVGDLNTDGRFLAQGNIAAKVNAATMVYLGDVIGSSQAGIVFGLAQDTNLYRSAANTLKTNGTLHVGVGVKFPDNTVQTTAAAGPGLATTLPGSPVDGQEAILVDSLTLPTYAWRFRYTASITDAYKWVYVGGAPIVTEVATIGTINSGTYGALASAGPSFALPRAGIYEVEVGARMYNNTASADAAMSYDIGGTAAVDADAVDTFGPGVTDATHNSMVKTKTIATAVTLTAKYRSAAGSTASFEKRFMRVVPVRVA